MPNGTLRLAVSGVLAFATGVAGAQSARPATETLSAGSRQLEEIIVTNSIPLTPDKRLPTMTVLTVAPLLGEAIRRIHDEESVSTMFA